MLSIGAASGGQREYYVNLAQPGTPITGTRSQTWSEASSMRCRWRGKRLEVLIGD